MLVSVADSEPILSTVEANTAGGTHDICVLNLLHQHRSRSLAGCGNVKLA